MTMELEFLRDPTSAVVQRPWKPSASAAVRVRVHTIFREYREFLQSGDRGAVSESASLVVRPLSDVPASGAVPVRFASLADSDLCNKFAQWHVSPEKQSAYHARLDALVDALELSGFTRPVAYDSEDSDLVLEVGPKSRSLTVILRPTETVAMFRTGAAEDFEAKALAVRRLVADPSAVALQQVAEEYRSSLWQSSLPLAPQSQQTGSLAVA